MQVPSVIAERTAALSCTQVKPSGRAGDWVHKLTLSPEEGGQLELRTPKLRLSILRLQFQVQASRERGVQFNYR